MILTGDFDLKIFLQYTNIEIKVRFTVRFNIFAMARACGKIEYKTFLMTIPELYRW